MTPPYPIYLVRSGPGDVRPAQALETMGSKAKRWLRNARTGRLVMLKFARAGSGEDWSEKVAFEIGRRLGIPCPRIDLARTESQQGVLCWDFLRRKSFGTPDATHLSLIHGNELLLRSNADYPSGRSYRVSKHTLHAVHEVLQGQAHLVRTDALGLTRFDAFGAFVGYLLLDALIGNTDRHHENWGLISSRHSKPARTWLAPSYDHASSLGRELNDDKRRRRLDGSGRGTLQGYAEAAGSAFWADSGSRQLGTLEALRLAGERRPDALSTWLAQLETVPEELLFRAVERVPISRLSPLGKRFTCEILRYNRRRILSLRR